MPLIGPGWACLSLPFYLTAGNGATTLYSLSSPGTRLYSPGLPPRFTLIATDMSPSPRSLPGPSLSPHSALFCSQLSFYIFICLATYSLFSLVESHLRGGRDIAVPSTFHFTDLKKKKKKTHQGSSAKQVSWFQDCLLSECVRGSKRRGVRHTAPWWRVGNSHRGSILQAVQFPTDVQALCYYLCTNART